MVKKKEGGSKFRDVPLNPDFSSMEKAMLKNWYDSGVVDKYIKKNENSKKYFSFIDGPITANNPMGVHHAWGRTYKDLWQRYFNMKGYKQRFQNGFDAQGLWVEVEVEKEHGFKSKKDIEKYGVAKFVEDCKSRVKKYSGVQTEQSKRLGYFMDWDNSYFTMSDENNYMIWHFLKVVNENGWLYKGADSVPWCPRCETAISQHEMLTEDYKEVSHDSIYMAFPLKDKKDEFLLVWTTTPWTIPANIAVAVDKKLNYSLVVSEDKKYWVASDAKDRLFGKEAKAISTFKGKDLEGLKYLSLFDDLPAVSKVLKENPDKMRKVILTDDLIMPINTSEGTGLVHTAVSAGSEDFKLGKKLGLPMIPVIDDNANYIDGFGFLTGKNAKQDPWEVLGYMKEMNKKFGEHWVYKIEKYKHRYPACWRCRTELVWKVTDEWYIAMDTLSKLKTNDTALNAKTLRQRMIDVAKQIEWIPEFGLKRELDWLNNMSDWLISKKNRYWGLALPIWECTKCKQFEVIGSKEELKQKAEKGWEKFEGKSPHKPQIDEIKLKCEKCGGIALRIEPVGNPWLDAGIVAYSTIKKNNVGEPLYLSDKSQWQKWVPADLITESFPGQFKNWFYSLIAMSTVLENMPPTKRILGYATCVAEDGRAMHKSWGNSIEFSEGADKIGVDVMRWMYTKQSYDQNLLFGYNVADQTRRQFHLTLWNIYRFFVTYANSDGFTYDPQKGIEFGLQKYALDTWIVIRLNETEKKVTGYMENYDAKSASEEIESLVSDMSLWYIRRSRDRVGMSAGDPDDKLNFYKTCRLILVRLSILLSPFTPFIAEEIFTNLSGNLSVHLAQLKDPTEGEENLVKDFKDLIPWMNTVRKISELGHSQRKEKGVPVRQPLSKIHVKFSMDKPSEDLFQLIKDELNVQKVEWKMDKSSVEPVVQLDFEITKKLKDEGEARNIVRTIQNARKELGTDMHEFVDVTIEDWPDEFVNDIKNKALVRELTKGGFKISRLKE